MTFPPPYARARLGLASSVTLSKWEPFSTATFTTFWEHSGSWRWYFKASHNSHGHQVSWWCCINSLEQLAHPSFPRDMFEYTLAGTGWPCRWFLLPRPKCKTTPNHQVTLGSPLPSRSIQQISKETNAVTLKGIRIRLKTPMRCALYCLYVVSQ